MRRVDSNVIIRVVTVLVLLTSAVPLFAQNGNSFDFNGIARSLNRLLLVIMGLGSMVSLTFAIYHLISGKQEAAKKIAWVFIGLGLGSALLYITSLHATSVPAVSGGFDGLKASLREVLQSALAIVAMFSITVQTIMIFRGDEQAYRRLFVWVITISLGSAILNVI